MSLDVAHLEIAPWLGRLAPYARDLLRRTGLHALQLHADVVAPEHLLSTLMSDPRSAAHASVLHAFADPQTISDEALAISPGLMVVASGSTLPFSPKAARVLEAVHARCSEAGAGEVSVDDLLAEAGRALDGAGREALRRAGFDPPGLAPAQAGVPAVGTVSFKHFSTSAKRTLSAANRLAAGERATAISPAHLLLACLTEDATAASRVGLNFHRARSALAGATSDSSAPTPRLLPPDTALVEFLRELPPASDSLELLARFHAGGTPELAGILNRSKVSAGFLARVRGSFRDPP